MNKLNVFNFITLNGFYKGPNEDISWHKEMVGEEENEHAEKNSNNPTPGILLFGRVTYQMMMAYWPTPMAQKNNPVIANGMNKAEKIVFSKTLKKADWNNTRIVNNNMIEEVKKLKETSGKDMTILGSGSIVTQLADAGLIDGYQFMMDPVVLGKGTPVFNGIHEALHLKLVNTKVHKSGVIVLNYESVKK
ncbi:MAG: dihydrofolate reductase family protein [Chitinophagaceae bacterium]